MSLKDDLRPTGRNRVIDLVSAAGVDVSDWGNYSRGPEHAAVNPKYCYEWSFVDSRGSVVLNIWFRNIDERRGEVSVSTNMRRYSRDLARRGAKPVWIARAARMDDAIRHAASSGAIVRVIVNEGDMRDAKDPKAKPSVVKARLLDPVPWSVAKYDSTTGQATLVRGSGSARHVVDQFVLRPEGTRDPEQVDVHGKAFVRDPAVRAATLARAAGRCEYCGTPGFVTKSGDLFLETHHIVPLSEGGSDTLDNSAAVCPNHHREAHHGASGGVIREFLLQAARAKKKRAV